MRRLLALLLVLVMATPAQAVAPSLVERLERGMLHIIHNGIPEHGVEPWRRHPLARKPIERRELARAIGFAAGEWNVDPFLMLSIAFREGSFRKGQVGDLGEKTVFQIMPRTARKARELEPRCSLESQDGAALCAATLLSHLTEKCGSVRGGFIKYATGRTCNADTAHLQWLARDRLGIAKILEEL